MELPYGVKRPKALLLGQQTYSHYFKWPHMLLTSYQVAYIIQVWMPSCPQTAYGRCSDTPVIHLQSVGRFLCDT